GVPGTVAGMTLAHERYGRLPWKQLLQTAIELAGDGMVPSRDEAFALEWGKARQARSPACARACPACGRVGPARGRATGAARPGLERRLDPAHASQPSAARPPSRARHISAT